MKKNKLDASTPIHILLSALICIGLIAAGILLLTVLGSFLLMSAENPLAHTSTASIVILLLSVFIGSFISQKITGTTELSNLLAGLTVSAVLLCLTSFCNNAETQISPLLITLVYLLVPALSYIGALLSRKNGEKKRKPAFRRNKYKRTHK